MMCKGGKCRSVCSSLDKSGTASAAAEVFSQCSCPDSAPTADGCELVLPELQGLLRSHVHLRHLQHRLHGPLHRLLLRRMPLVGERTFLHDDGWNDGDVPPRPLPRSLHHPQREDGDVQREWQLRSHGRLFLLQGSRQGRRRVSRRGRLALQGSRNASRRTASPTPIRPLLPLLLAPVALHLLL